MVGGTSFHRWILKASRSRVSKSKIKRFLISKNQNSSSALAQRDCWTQTLYVSLDNADKVIEGGLSLHSTIPTEGAHPCVFCKGGRRCCGRNFCPFYTTRCWMPSPYPPFAKYAKDGAPASVVASAVWKPVHTRPAQP